MRKASHFDRFCKHSRGSHDSLGQSVIGAEKARSAGNLPRDNEKHPVPEAEKAVSAARGLECAAHLVTPLTKQAPNAAAGGNQGGTLASLRSCLDSIADICQRAKIQ